MAEISVSAYGAKISITNTSTTKVLTANNEGFIVTATVSDNGGFISPSYKSTAFVETVIPQMVIKVPSFVTYKVNTINPGDTLSFIVTTPDEILYYQGFISNGIEGISVTVEELEEPTVDLQDVTVTPSTEEQTITCEEGYDGIGTVTVNAVTASIDENITAENIKKDVEILGVTGVYEGSGVSIAEESDVNFYDWNGSIVYSYTAEEFAELEELPTNPTHEGLTAQGWNWTLSQAQNYVANYGKCDIGQLYTTDDGKTRLYCTFNEGALNPYLHISASNASVTIDWGDNTTPETITVISESAVSHTYANAGDYVITLESNKNFTLHNYILTKDTEEYDGYPSIVSGEIQLSENYYNTGGYPSCITKIEFGSNCYVDASGCPSIQYCIGNEDIRVEGCVSLQFIILPAGITAVDKFIACYSLRKAILPYGVTEIGTYGDHEDNGFFGCRSLTSIIIPDSVTAIYNSSFWECKLLHSIIIPNSVTNAADSAGYEFSYCTYLNNVVLSNQYSEIPSGAFMYCSSLQSIIIPASVENIYSSAFSDCYSLNYIKFEPTTPPAVDDSNAFYELPETCKIYVPTGTLSDYTSAENYPDPSTYTYIEY